MAIFSRMMDRRTHRWRTASDRLHGDLGEAHTGFAALIGAILGSTLSFMYGRSMEKYKQGFAFDIRRREIRYSKLHDKRLETVEGLHGRFGKLLETLTILTAFIQNPKRKNPAELTDDDIRLDRHEKVLKVFEAMEALKDFHRGRSIYLPENLDDRIKQECHALDMLYRKFHISVEITQPGTKEFHEAWIEAIKGVEDAQGTIRDVAKEFRRLVTEDDF